MKVWPRASLAACTLWTVWLAALQKNGSVQAVSLEDIDHAVPLQVVDDPGELLDGAFPCDEVVFKQVETEQDYPAIVLRMLKRCMSTRQVNS